MKIIVVQKRLRLYFSQDETFDSFITSLKELVKQFDFKSDEDRLLKSRVVLGIQNKDVQERLLREDWRKLFNIVEQCRQQNKIERNWNNQSKRTEYGIRKTRQNLKVNIIIIKLKKE